MAAVPAKTTAPRAPHRWVEAVHHPVIEAVSHIASPLSAALLIFGVHKAWQVPAFRALVKSVRVLGVRRVRRSTRLRRSRAHANARRSARTRARDRLAQAARVHWRTKTDPALVPPLSLSRLFSRRAVAAAAAPAMSAAPAPPAPHAPLDDPSRLEALAQLYAREDVSLAAQHLAHMASVQAVEGALQALHATTGLPWWATLAGFTLLLRTLILPVNISLLRNSLRMKLIMPDVQAALTRLRDLAAPAAERVAAAEAFVALLKRRGCGPLRNFVVPLGFPPLVLSFFGAVHNLCVSEPALATEGALWFSDLIEPDPTFLLPILSAVSWLWVVEAGSGVYYHSWPSLRATTRVVALAFIPLATNLPAGVFVFWITSNLYAISRTYILRTDVVRRALRMPLASEIRRLEYLPKRVE
jgi:YidC/Oxa1 family membrane protein insertase